jgi:hypothetical protein
MLRIRGGKDEGRLRVVELSCDPWHKLRRDSRRIGKDGELIATEDVVGEDVRCEVPRVHGGVMGDE